MDSCYIPINHKICYFFSRNHKDLYSQMFVIVLATYMYAYTSMATGEDVPNVSRTNSVDHGFTQDWVNNHANRVAQRQIEVHNDPNSQPRTQVHQEEEERK